MNENQGKNCKRSETWEQLLLESRYILIPVLTFTFFSVFFLAVQNESSFGLLCCRDL